MVKVLLYSGGLDSYCLNYIIKPDIRLYIDIGTKESINEITTIEKSGIKVEFVKFKELSKFELPNKIIPFRNCFFVLLASQYGDEIYLASTYGDTTKDKDYVFKAQIEAILNYFASDQDKINIKCSHYEVKLPFKELTKSEIVREYIKLGGNIQSLLKYSRSCYMPINEKECGRCRSCLRKAVALAKNNIDITDYFETFPFLNIDNNIHQKMLSRGREGQDYLEVLKKLV